jgi:molybdenum cofactor biosynthesis protein B
MTRPEPDLPLPPAFALPPEGPTPRPVAIAVITVSDTRTLADDTSGALLVERAEIAGHRVVSRALCRDEVALVRAAVAEARERGAEAILCTGGTGITGRDVTVEALEGLFTKRIDGFGELFRMLSWFEVGASSIASRAVGGLIGTSCAFALPGSTSACRLAWDHILRHQLDVRARPCNLVSLFPRLDER